jgi:glyceraldehyde-3-phosphate dehydrogenase (NADP+)
VHQSLVNDFLPKLTEYVSKLKVGMPWEQGVVITPLPEEDKCKKLCAMVTDAQNKGAKIVNEGQGGGQCQQDNIFQPAILFPVTEEMELWHEDQFGPVLPVAEYNDINEVYQYLARSPYGLQASVYTQDSRSAAPLLDVLANTVCRININTGCGRLPPQVPETARRSSGQGTMSILDALEEFSVDVVVAAKQDALNEKVIQGFQSESKFLQPLTECASAGAGDSKKLKSGK